MPEFEALVTAIDQKIDGLQEELCENQDALLAVVETIKLLPEKYIPRTEAEKRSERNRVAAIVGAIVAGVLIISVGSVLYLNHGVTCGVRGILVSAQTASTRNPLPNDLTDAQREEALRRRADANEFYQDGLDRLNIIWPCAGEDGP